MANLVIDGVSKTYKGGTEALRGISFDVADREAVFLLGPSGAGKTTTLRLVAGLEDATSGHIVINGRDVSRLTPRERNLAMVYDKHSLFPHLRVYDNLAYPLRVRKIGEDSVKQRVGDVADTLQISKLLDRYPSQLSGGQMQRVAIGRALVREADVYLLDEPISHLDAQLRAKMRVEFKRLQRDFHATMLYVSHDQLEAMTMADRIVLINKGQIEQIASPQHLFDCPATVFAATFVGEPAMNIIPAEITSKGDKHFLSIGEYSIAVKSGWLNSGEKLPDKIDALIGVRPHHLKLSDSRKAGMGTILGKIYSVETLGSRVIFDVETTGPVIRIMTTVDEAAGHPQVIGAPIAIRVDPNFIYLFDGKNGRTLRQAMFASRVH